MRKWNAAAAVAASLWFFLAFVANSLALGDDQNHAEAVPLNPKPGVYRSGSYLYTLTELPRTDGKPVLVGSLVRENAPVAGGDYYRLELPSGSFIWYPPAEGCLVIGWTRINPLMKHSRWTMAAIAEKKNAQGQWVTLPRDPIIEPPAPRKPLVPTGREQ